MQPVQIFLFIHLHNHADMKDMCVRVCVYLRGDQHGRVRQLVMVVHPEGEEQDGSNAHDRHQRVEQCVEQLRRRRVQRGCGTQTQILSNTPSTLRTPENLVH